MATERGEGEVNANIVNPLLTLCLGKPRDTERFKKRRRKMEK